MRVVDDLLAVLDALAPGERPLVVGHSFGGCVALELAARHPGRVAGSLNTPAPRCSPPARCRTWGRWATASRPSRGGRVRRRRR
ncbi:MAG: alpha/beta fold hydrolase [Chloroflexota bacterium]